MAKAKRASRESLPDSFWENVERVPFSTCWYWTGSLAAGYGRYGGNGAHRITYELVKGPIPDGLQIDHLCRERSCVNPDHMEAVTSRENSLRGIGPAARNARKTHCVRGHLLAGDNLRLGPGRYPGQIYRTCRACARELALGYFHEKCKALGTAWRKKYRPGVALEAKRKGRR